MEGEAAAHLILVHRNREPERENLGFLRGREQIRRPFVGVLPRSSWATIGGCEEREEHGGLAKNMKNA